MNFKRPNRPNDKFRPHPERGSLSRPPKPLPKPPKPFIPATPGVSAAPHSAPLKGGSIPKPGLDPAKPGARLGSGAAPAREGAVIPPGAPSSAGGDPATVGKPPTDWGEVAHWYDQLVGNEGSEYHKQVVMPGAIRLLGAQAGQEILDIACGQGVLCRLLAARGVKAVGVDAAIDLIRMARERNESLDAEKHPQPHYMTGDARKLNFLARDRYDSAACVLAIQNIHPITPVFEGVSRTLKLMGKFVVVMMHPCFRGPKESQWGWDPEMNVQYRRVDRYLVPRKAPIVTNPGKSMQYTWDFHKPIELYMKAARQSGLLADAMEEWPSHKTSTSGPRAPAENTSRKEIPMFLAMRFVKAFASDATGQQAEATHELESESIEETPG